MQCGSAASEFQILCLVFIISGKDHRGSRTLWIGYAWKLVKKLSLKAGQNPGQRMKKQEDLVLQNVAVKRVKMKHKPSTNTLQTCTIIQLHVTLEPVDRFSCF